MNQVDDFLARLVANAPKDKKEFEQTNNRSLEKVFLNFPGNFGRYQVFPMGSVLTESYPFVTLFGTREICIPRKMVDQNGTETRYNFWVRILPKDAYMMRDINNRVVSSLTALDEQILNQAYAIWDELWKEVDAKNNLEIQKTFIRKRNYTIFHGMCLNKWDPNESRHPSRQNFCALFVCTAKGFLNCIQDNIQEKSLMRGGDNQWLTEVYNRQLSGRTGFLMFSVNSKKDGSAGFAITTTHEMGNDAFKGIEISPEDAELMSDPVYTFLGYQANRDDQNPIGQKRLFNQTLMNEAITYMSEQLAAIRTRGEQDVKEVIKNISDEVLSRQVVTPRKMTNDPMLNDAMNSNQHVDGQMGVINPEAISKNNTEPFSSSPVFHADPVTGQPVNMSAQGNGFGQGWGGSQPQGAPFTPNLDFGIGNGVPNGGTNDDLPF